MYALSSRRRAVSASAVSDAGSPPYESRRRAEGNAASSRPACAATGSHARAGAGVPPDRGNRCGCQHGSHGLRTSGFFVERGSSSSAWQQQYQAAAARAGGGSQSPQRRTQRPRERGGLRAARPLGPRPKRGAATEHTLDWETAPRRTAVPVVTGARCRPKSPDTFERALRSRVRVAAVVRCHRGDSAFTRLCDQVPVARNEPGQLIRGRRDARTSCPSLERLCDADALGRRPRCRCGPRCRCWPLPTTLLTKKSGSNSKMTDSLLDADGDRVRQVTQ